MRDHPQLRLVRRYAYPPERVFDAWLDPSIASRFLFTTAESEVIRCDIDPRVGGAFVIVDRRADGEEIEHVGDYREVDRPRRLVFTFAVPQYDPTVTLVTLEIRPTEEGCELTLLHDGVPPEWAEQDVQGWTMILAALEGALA